MDLAHQLEIACQYHQQQRLQEAEALYRSIIEQEPGNVQARQLLGVLLAQTGHPEQGLSLLEQALQEAPQHPEIRLNLAGILQQLGRLDAALAQYRQLIQQFPDYGPAHQQLGELCRRLKHWQEAEPHLRRWLQLNAGDWEGWNSLANLYQAQGKWPEAERALAQALALQPGHPILRFNQANLCYLQGRHHEAEAAYRQVLAQSPEHIEALRNLAGVLRELQKLGEAEDCMQQACRLAPDQAPLWLGLGTVALEQGRYDLAIRTSQRALDLDPACFEAWVNLGFAYQHLGQFDRAQSSLDRAIALRPANLELQLRRVTLLPVLLENAAQALSLREKLKRSLEQLEQLDGRLEQPTRQLGQTAFFLAYHGLDDRALMERLARLYRKLAPSLNFKAPPRRSLRRQKLKLGFVSENLRSHTIGLLMGGLIEQLPRADFEISLFYFPRCNDPLARRLQAASDTTVELNYNLGHSQRLIAASEVDILFYTDIGLDIFTYCLAFARLAPVQCVTWGHGISTGIDSIDYFFSSRALEPADPQRCYSEELVLMEELIPFYSFPEIPACRLELPQGRLYLCPQSLFKLHPDFDTALAQILAEDPQAQLLLIEGSHPHWQQLLIARWQPLMGDQLARVHFLPRLQRPDFLALLARADVILDPFHFCGGNSSYEALAAGTPIVTLPGELLRDRITYALYQRMGLETGIARDRQDFVEIALRLGRDQAFNQAFRSRIAAQRHVLYHNHKAIAELAGLLGQLGRTAL
ncbi:MAG: tetratricopeptide repeat protein [Candidatus Sericytochromatia bacterium]